MAHSNSKVEYCCPFLSMERILNTEDDIPNRRETIGSYLRVHRRRQRRMCSHPSSDTQHAAMQHTMSDDYSQVDVNK
jgi:hypothetical protein